MEAVRQWLREISRALRTIQDCCCCSLYCRDVRNELTIRKAGVLGCLIVREPSNLENRNLLLLTHQLNTRVIITISSESGWI